MAVSRTARVIRAATLAATAPALLGPAGPASANEYTINACQADRAAFSTQAFEDFATRGMLWKRACDPEGPGLRGLVTANVVRSGRVPRGSRSLFVLRAPEGTRFARFRWSGQARRRDCRYALQLWASRPDGAPIPIKNVRANRGCPRRGYGQAAGWPRPRTYDVAGADKIVQRIVCLGTQQTPHCSSRGLNYIRTFKAQATVVDVSRPTVSIVRDNPFTRGEWVRGLQRIRYQAWDNVGVKAARAVVGGLLREAHSRGCNYALRIPCTNGEGLIPIDTRRLAEGSQAIVVEARDAAENIGLSVGATVRIDNTAPGAVAVAVEGGEAWRNRNDFDLAWTNPSEGDRAPIAGAHYRVCRTDGRECSTASVTGVGTARIGALTVPNAGEWHVRVWRSDAAGNQEPANASVPVPLRYDPEPPQLGFEEARAVDPTLVSVFVTDGISGLAGGQIELSREGSGLWQSLSTVRHGSRLLARIDDGSLPAGRYVLRATAHDQASNQSSSDKRLDGRTMTLDLPLRIPTTMRAGVMRTKLAHRTPRGRRHRRPVNRRRVTLLPTVRVGFGRRVKVGGRLKIGDGQPLPGAEVEVFSRTGGSPEQPVGRLRTDRQGRYAYPARATATRTLRFAFRGTALMLPAEREVTLLTSAASTLRAQPRLLRNGESVAFSGSLRSLPTPPAGKLVELQVVLSGRWQTFRTTRTDAKGAWRIGYRFRRSCGVLRYRFRARLPAEAGYRFETGRTRATTVRVRGAPCR
jgi:hypothetical protein